MKRFYIYGYCNYDDGDDCIYIKSKRTRNLYDSLFEFVQKIITMKYMARII